MVERYYVVQTQPQRELVASKEIQNQGFKTFLPIVEHLPKVRNGRTEPPRLRPLFPKYIFVQFDAERDRWRSLNGTRGVVRVICMDDSRPSPVPTAAMDRLLAIGEFIREDKAALPFNPGDVVQFTEGSMKGIQGVVKLCSDQRVVLLLNLLGGEVTTQTDPKSLVYIPSFLSAS